jgi:signal transduction histidine kinase
LDCFVGLFPDRRPGEIVRTQDLVRRHQAPAPAPDAGGPRDRPAAGSGPRGGLRRLRPFALDIAWAAFAGVNLAAMRLFPAWGTVPFLAIWVSLTVIYGFRLWRLQPTILTLAAVTLATGGIIGVQVSKGQQDADYLAEVPLIALMFLVMVWHGRRRLAATQDRLTAVEELHRVSQENLRLLQQQRQFLVDASHELGTPITVALGHAELIEQAVTDQGVAADARVVTGELARLRRLTNRLLLLASAGTPGFLQVMPVATDSLILDALERWGHVPRHWRLGEAAEATVPGDADRLVVALDALLENAVAHTQPADRIEVSVHLEGTSAVIAVADSGRKTWTTSSAASPAPSPTSAARPAGSASACPSCRPSPRPTTVRSGSTAPTARAPPSRWSSPPSPRYL